ncbi:Uncharacterised protein [Staphylococcus schleiferi]|uniref:Uncharacterized protein n=1 Tax=Staphylococcus schleiferi TaxID=1295 RepID=A0A7Z7VWZ5_STASC|nr:Uncharacterised protein [Staphylococcus schleiferi]SUM88526.1 Uncharacterised protein [Staphylococcus schleiferi]
MISINASSIIERRPRAPVLRSIAFSLIAANASSVNSNETPSNSSIFVYCLTSAFLGCVKIFLSASTSNVSRLATIGTRPINSGIKP